MPRSPRLPFHDWVSALDRAIDAKKRDQHPSWSEIAHDESIPFLLIRYPHLQPPASTPAQERQLRTLHRMVESRRSQLNEIGVLPELSDRRAQEFAAVVLEFDAKYGMWGTTTSASARNEAARGKRKPLGKVHALNRESGVRAWLKQTKRLTKYGPGQVRKLRRELARIESATNGFLVYANTLNSLLGRAAIVAGEAILAAVNEVTLPSEADMARFYKRSVDAQAQSSDPTDEAIERLVGYLVYCGLDRNEAMVRVAKVGNDRWDWNVKFIEKYDGVEQWKDAPAIRQRLARRSRRKNKLPVTNK